MNNQRESGRNNAQRKRNGGKYVTWAWILGIVMTAAIGLLIRAISQNDRELENIKKRLSIVEEKQADIRERVRILEVLLPIP